jgi:hypothetical protein
VLALVGGPEFDSRSKQKYLSSLCNKTAAESHLFFRMTVAESFFPRGKATGKRAGGRKDLTVYFYIVSQIRIRGATSIWSLDIENFLQPSLRFTNEKSDSPVDTATDYTQDSRGAESWQRKIWPLLHNAQTSSGPTRSPIQRVLRAMSPEVKRLGHKDDHSPPSCAKVKNDGAIRPLPNMPS